MSNRSTSIETLQDIEQFVGPYPYNQADLDPNINSLLCCADARCPHRNDQVLKGNMYYQVGGGIQGLGNAAALAMEVQEPGSTEIMSSDKIGQTIAKASPKEIGMQCEIHHECLAIQADREVMGIIAGDTNADLFRNAKLIEPTYKAVNHQNFVDAAARRVPLVKRPEQLYKSYQAFKRSLGHAATAATLWTNNVKPKGFLAIQDTSYAFDVQAANKAKSPYYVYTREAGMLLAPVVEKLFGVDQELFIGAMGIYHTGVHAGIEQVRNMDLPITKVELAI